jgi:prolyl-tRNA synthetase
VKTLGELQEAIEGGAGFVFTGWSGDPKVEEAVKERMKATIRVLPSEEFRSADTPSRCVSGNGAATTEVAWARAY